MISVTFPDGASRAFEPGVSGLDIAKSISPSLAKRTVAMTLDGELVDLAESITKDSKIEFVARDDARALELIRHDAAHVLAQAVQTRYPGTQVTIGPVIENGFYYDFYRDEPFTPEDFAAIEAEAASNEKPEPVPTLHPNLPALYRRKVEALEGPAPQGTVILEFPSLEAARAWYESPAYREASLQRKKAGEFRVLFVEGLA